MSIWVSLSGGTKTDVKEIKVSDSNSGFACLDVKRAFIYKDASHPRVELFPTVAPTFTVTPIVDDVSPTLTKDTPVGMKISYAWSRNESCAGACVYFCGDTHRSKTSSTKPGEFTLLTTCCRTAYAKYPSVWVVDKGIDSISNPLYRFTSNSNYCYRVRHAFLSTACLYDFDDAHYDNTYHRWAGCFWICMCDDHYLNASRGYTVEIACCNDHAYKTCNFSSGGLRRFYFCYRCLKDSPETHITITPKSELGNGVSCQITLKNTSTSPPPAPSFICWTNIGSSSSHLCLCQTHPEEVLCYSVTFTYKCNHTNSNGYFRSRTYTFLADKTKEKFVLPINTTGLGSASFFSALDVCSYKPYITDPAENHYGFLYGHASVNVSGLPVAATPAAPDYIIAKNIHQYGISNHTYVEFFENIGVPAYYYYLCANFSGVVRQKSELMPKNTNGYIRSVYVNGYASHVSYKLILCNCYQKYFNASKFKYNSTNFVRSYTDSVSVEETIYY